MDNTVEEDEEAVQEPQVTSSDPEIRKLARALRIQRRIEAIKKQHLTEGEDLEEEVEQTLLEKQIEKSAEVLEQLILEGEEIVTNVRIGNDAREVGRREKEAARRFDLLEKLQTEAKDAEEMFETISSKWESIGAYKDPLDIHESVALQKEKCDELIKQKDEIIAMLREEINMAEMKFAVDQEIQKDDVTVLVRRIDNQVDLMRKSYKNELKLIEDTIAFERKMLMEANNKKWEGLYKQRNENEELNMERKIQLQDEFMIAWHDARVEAEEVYRETKINLENECDMLQQELEHLKASCLLNGEKLDYNYQILKKREEENIIIRSQQKRLINKLQDEINAIKRKTRNYKQQSEEKIAKLTLEIHKLRDCVLDVERKADYLSLVNDQKYHQVWDLNEKTVKDTLKTIITTDRIIHEQLLGRDWKYPKKHLFKKTNLPSFKYAKENLGLKKVKKDEKSDDREEVRVPDTLVKNILDKIAYRSGFFVENRLKYILPDLTENLRTLIKVENVFNGLGITNVADMYFLMEFFLPYTKCKLCENKEKNPNDETSVTSDHETSHATAEKVKKVDEKKSFLPDIQADAVPDIVKAVHELPFVLNDIVNEELNEYTTTGFDEQRTEEGAEVETETVASSITSKTAVSKITTMIPQGPPITCRLNHPLLIESGHVLRAMKDFVLKNKDFGTARVTIADRLEHERQTLSRIMAEDDVQMFWTQFLYFFTKNHEDLWDGLLFGLQKYYAILQDRHAIYLETKKLRRQNIELNHLLKNCEYKKRKSKPDLLSSPSSVSTKTRSSASSTTKSRSRRV